MIESCASVEHCGWLSLRMALWPHCSQEEHLIEMTRFLAQPERFIQFVAYDTTRKPIGMAEASLRSDYVNGTKSSPVGFLEGLYVVPNHRGQGLARELVAAVAQWAASRGCRELATDAMLNNRLSHMVYQSLGFTETERVIYFRKALPVR